MTTPWPPLHAYALTHRCPTCRAEPGKPCNAPRKNTEATRTKSTDPAHRLHATRQDLGIRHYNRDIGNAPWTEDREPGRRYDSIGDQWSPAPEMSADGH